MDEQSHTDNLNFKTANKVRKIVHIITEDHIFVIISISHCRSETVPFVSISFPVMLHTEQTVWAHFSKFSIQNVVYIYIFEGHILWDIDYYRCHIKQWYTKLLISDRCLQYVFIVLSTDFPRYQWVSCLIGYCSGQLKIVQYIHT